jgi:purine nucleoside phosphorylase
MSMQPRFETARETTMISKIVADLVRTVQLIECEIAAQEERASVSDRSDVKYPMQARALIERRDNLKMTIDALEQRLVERAPHKQATAA